MDSLTQFTLGAAVSALCLGKTLGPRKAALIGGVLGTLPDLDVFLPFDDPVDSFVFHRGWTHSVLIHALAAPLIGELLVRSFKALTGHRFLVWLSVFLCFTTHAMIDAMTVYGTRMFWPLYPDPIGVGSIFIIDLVYTVPLLAAVIWAFLRKHWSAGLRNGLATALMASSAYMALGLVWQANAESRAKIIFARAGIDTNSIFAIASPFNSVWRVIGLQDDRYHNLYLSLFDDDLKARIYAHPRHPELAACLGDNAAFEKLQWFSRGYYRVDMEGQNIIVSDLRMGLTPNYVFRFGVAQFDNGTVNAIAPKRGEAQTNTIAADLSWLANRIQGRPAIRQTEVTEAELKSQKC